MKRNAIFNELVEIRKQLQFNLEAMPACARLSRLIEAIDDDRHLNYDQFECIEDLVSRFKDMQDQMHAIEQDIVWIKSGKFHKR